jgi:hypothetical protein
MTTLPISLYIPSRVASDFVAPPSGVTVKEKKQIYHFDAEGFSVLKIVLEFGSGVAVSVVAAWLYDAFLKKDPAAKERELTIREVQYRIESREQLVEVLEREIKVRTKE